MWVRFLGQEDPLEEGMATPSSILVWRIPWTEELGGLQSIGSRRVGHNWSDLACTHTLLSWSLSFSGGAGWGRWWGCGRRSCRLGPSLLPDVLQWPPQSSGFSCFPVSHALSRASGSPTRLIWCPMSRQYQKHTCGMHFTVYSIGLKFWHQRPVLWKTIFTWMAGWGGGMVQAVMQAMGSSS